MTPLESGCCACPPRTRVGSVVSVVSVANILRALSSIDLTSRANGRCTWLVVDSCEILAGWRMWPCGCNPPLAEAMGHLLRLAPVHVVCASPFPGVPLVSGRECRQRRTYWYYVASLPDDGCVAELTP